MKVSNFRFRLTTFLLGLILMVPAARAQEQSGSSQVPSALVDQVEAAPTSAYGPDTCQQGYGSSESSTSGFIPQESNALNSNMNYAIASRLRRVGEILDKVANRFVINLRCVPTVHMVRISRLLDKHSGIGE